MNALLPGIARLNEMLSRPRGVLDVWVIYDHPLDHPEDYVARRWILEMATTDYIVTSSLGKMREVFTRMGFYCVARNPTDDEKIVEVWI